MFRTFIFTSSKSILWKDNELTNIQPVFATVSEPDQLVDGGRDLKIAKFYKQLEGNHKKPQNSQFQSVQIRQGYRKLRQNDPEGKLAKNLLIYY